MESNFQAPVSYPSPSKQPRSKNTFFVLAMCLVALFGILALNNTSPRSNTDLPFTKEDVEVKKTDLANTQGEARIPSGFPKDFPIETETITESYVMDYTARGVVQHTVTFTTTLSQPEAFEKYKKALESAGFTTELGGGGVDISALNAYKDGDDFSLIVSSSGGVTTVQASYLDRK